METIKLKDGIKMHILPDDKFKNFKAGVYLSTPLSKDTAAKNALLARLMRSGTKNLPDKRSINMHLEKLYGASLYAGVEKNGENHIISVCIDALSDKYIEDESILKSVFELLGDVLLCSTMEAIDREKQALIDEIRASVNDKRKYALSRCVEEMCADEAFGTSVYGKEEDVLKTDKQAMLEHYKNVLENAAADIFVIGSFDRDAVINECRKLAQKLPDREEHYPVTVQCGAPAEVKYVTDRENISQGKLVIGYRANVTEENIYPMMVYNAVFGGGTSSKLFNNVREKLSLCYYASSALRRKKGLILVQAGIDFENYQKTLDEIINQSEDIKKGNVDTEEFEGAILGLVNNLRSCKDDLSQLLAYYSSCIGEPMIDIDEMTRKILSVKMEQITDVARQIDMDTVYFLRGNGTESDNEG